MASWVKKFFVNSAPGFKGYLFFSQIFPASKNKEPSIILENFCLSSVFISSLISPDWSGKKLLLSAFNGL